MKRAVVVAHPDDEVLWAGGLLLRFPGDWTVICCSTPAKDPVRAEHFFDACDAMGVKGKIFPEKDIKDVPLKFLDRINLEEFDHIFTHNRWGEQGHLHHKQVHRHVLSRYGHKQITTFGYRPKGRGVHLLELTNDELDRKMEAFRKYRDSVMHKVRPEWKGCVDFIKRKIGSQPLVYKEGPLWTGLAQFYFTNKGLNPAVETYDGAWF